MYLFDKFKEQGPSWFLRRIVREFIEPTTTFGKYLRPCSFFVYYLVDKPINFLQFLCNVNIRSKNALYFFYDFEVEPITYDFVWALCLANSRREELGLSQLRIVLVPGTNQGLRKEQPGYEQIVDRDARSWRIYNILLPVIKLLSCSSSITLCATRKEAMLIREKQARFFFPERYNVTFPVSYSPQQAMYYCQKIMALRADQQALRYVFQWLSEQMSNKKVIVITLRQYAYSPARNSNIMAWSQFVNALDKEKYFVVFVPDTEQAVFEKPSELNEFEFFYPACWNLIMRSALYELAYLNLGVNNGPMALCWLNSRCRYITFKINVENEAQAPIDVLINRGFIPGENPKFTGFFQKWVWELDSFDVISREFSLMCESLDSIP